MDKPRWVMLSDAVHGEAAFFQAIAALEKWTNKYIGWEVHMLSIREYTSTKSLID